MCNTVCNVCICIECMCILRVFSICGMYGVCMNCMLHVFINVFMYVCMYVLLYVGGSFLRQADRN